jgi:hypothetical protein
LVQYGDHQVDYVGRFGFHNQKKGGRDAKPTKNKSPIKVLAKLTKEKNKEREREREATIYRKIVSLEALVDQQGWKVSLPKGMYITKLSALI